MNFSAQNVLLVTAGLVGVELAFIALLLARRGLFHWLSAGFWAWSAFMLYYVISPLSAISSSNLSPFQIRLQVSGGGGRGLWVALVIFIGITVFYAAYLRTVPRPVDLGVQRDTPFVTPFFFYWLVIFIGFGLYALLASRAGLATWQGERVIEGGRFVGSVTGYQNAGYMLLFYPTLLLLLWPNRIARSVGLILVAAFVILSIPHAYSRYATVSMLLALTMWRNTQQQRRWPGLFALLGLLLVVLIYQARGHAVWQLAETPQAIADSLDIVGEKGVAALAESDTQMLATFWVESAWSDNWIGYDYGLRFLNYVLIGWIPGRFLPQKYFLVDWLAAQRPPYPPIFDQLLFGAKSSLIGSFYANGQIIAVVLQMALMGWLSRRLDGMIQPKAPVAVHALGIAWLSVLWIVWGSHDYWGLMLMGTMALPFLIGIPLFRLQPRTPISGLLTAPRKIAASSRPRTTFK